MIQGVLLLFLAYLTPGFELNTTLIDTINIENKNIKETEIIRNAKDLERVNKVLGKDVKLPVTYFVDEVLILKQLGTDEDPDSVRVIDTKKFKDGSYRVTYTAAGQEISPENISPYMVLKVKPVADKKASFSFASLDSEDPIFVHQSLDTNPSYGNIQIQESDLIFYDFFPLDKGNSWTYKFTDGKKNSEITSEIKAFTKGWSIFDNFFGKKRIALKVDGEGRLLTSSKEGIRSFYNESVNITKPDEEVTVEAGTFKDILVVSIPENDRFWFRDVFARDVGLIYHEHHSSKGSFYYQLKRANVAGKSIP